MTVLAIALVSVSACTSASGTKASPEPGAATLADPAPPVSPPAAGGDWITYHANAARTGRARGVPRPGRLRIAWTTRLDGAVYGQPLVIGGLVVAATEGDSIYGLAASTGRVRWHAHLGRPVPLADLPCGDISPLGITGTPAYDPANGLVYAVAETTGFHHVLVGVSVANGAVRVRRQIATPDGRPRYDQQRGALLVADGRVYIPFGGLYGDCGPYRGSVVGVPVSGRGGLVSYTVPTAREGGIWAPGGPVLSPAGTLYVSVGNGAATSGRFDGSDSVTALSAKLRRTGIFAPATWAADNAADLDLGSMSPALLGDGRILAVGKRGTGYLLRASRLGGVGGQVASAPVCNAFGGAAVAGTVAFIPCGSGGPAAVATSRTHLRVLWRGPAGAAGSPVLGGGAVWVANYGAGILYALGPGTGRVLRRISVGSGLPHFASPTLSGGLALLGTRHGVVAISGA